MPRRLSSIDHGEWRSLVAHPAGGRAVAGSNPVSPIRGIACKSTTFGEILEMTLTATESNIRVQFLLVPLAGTVAASPAFQAMTLSDDMSCRAEPNQIERPDFDRGFAEAATPFVSPRLPSYSDAPIRSHWRGRDPITPTDRSAQVPAAQRRTRPVRQSELNNDPSVALGMKLKSIDSDAFSETGPPVLAPVLNRPPTSTMLPSEPVVR